MNIRYIYFSFIKAPTLQACISTPILHAPILHFCMLLITDIVVVWPQLLVTNITM